MARILIGNIKGPAGKIVSVSATKGEPGTDPQVTNVGTESDAKLQFVIPEGQKGEQGLQGPTGPMPPLVNNLTTNQAGQGALDAAQGKALADKDTALQSAVDALNRKTDLGNSYTNLMDGASIATNSSFVSNGIATLNMKISNVTCVVSTANVVLKLPSNFAPTKEVYVVATRGNEILGSCWIRVNGELCIQGVDLTKETVIFIGTYKTANLGRKLTP